VLITPDTVLTNSRFNAAGTKYFVGQFARDSAAGRPGTGRTATGEWVVTTRPLTLRLVVLGMRCWFSQSQPAESCTPIKLPWRGREGSVFSAWAFLVVFVLVVFNVAALRHAWLGWESTQILDKQLSVWSLSWGYLSTDLYHSGPSLARGKHGPDVGHDGPGRMFNESCGCDAPDIRPDR
jgi:hypothetical protein